MILETRNGKRQKRPPATIALPVYNTRKGQKIQVAMCIFKKNLKKYFQLIMTALICFVMGVIEDKKRICIKDTDSKKDRTVLRPDDKKNNRKNKIIYWNEPRIQNRINRAVYFNTG